MVVKFTDSELGVKLPSFDFAFAVTVYEVPGVNPFKTIDFELNEISVGVPTNVFRPEKNDRVCLYFLGQLRYTSGKKEKIPHNNTSGKRQVEM